MSKRYFDTIQAPRKEYVLLQRTGHDPNQAMVDATRRILTGQVAAFIQ